MDAQFKKDLADAMIVTSLEMLELALLVHQIRHEEKETDLCQICRDYILQSEHNRLLVERLLDENQMPPHIIIRGNVSLL